MKPRSPVLGYNHNVRYAGRLWHVQTEDSGVNNPHIFTHLFHEGTILSTKRLDYDPALDVNAVQKMMQTQHKAMLKDLKGGTFDEKIAKFFGAPVIRDATEDTDPTRKPATTSATDLEPETVEALVMGLNAAADIVSGPPTDKNLRAVDADGAPLPAPELPPPPSGLPPSPPGLPPPPARSAPAAKTDPDNARVAPQSPLGNLPRAPAVQRPPARLPPPRPGAVARPAAPGAPGAPPARNVMGIGGRRAQPTGQASPYGGSKPTAEGVVVARPAVIVGSEPTAVRGGPPTRPASAAPPPRTSQSGTRWHAPTAPAGGAASNTKPGSPQDNIFGGDLISEKSLDEVILAYLSEDLNDK
jgi:hypothetical protein